MGFDRASKSFCSFVFLFPGLNGLERLRQATAEMGTTGSRCVERKRRRLAAKATCCQSGPGSVCRCRGIQRLRWPSCREGIGTLMLVLGVEVATRVHVRAQTFEDFLGHGQLVRALPVACVAACAGEGRRRAWSRVYRIGPATGPWDCASTRKTMDGQPTILDTEMLNIQITEGEQGVRTTNVSNAAQRPLHVLKS